MIPFFHLFFLLLAVPNLLLGTYSQAEKTRMLADLEIIKNEIEVIYAPAEWKKSFINWNLEAELGKARQKIFASQNLTPRGYQQIIRDFFNSLHDMHVNVSFYSTEFAVLPFLVQGVNQRYFVVWMSKKWADDNHISMAVGDEIIAFDGRPVAEVIEELKCSSYGLSDNAACRHLSELLLTIREGDALQEVPQGEVEVLFKKKNSLDTKSFVAEWHYVPEEIDQDFVFFSLPQEKTLDPDFFYKNRSLPLHTRWQKHHLQKIYGSQWLGDTKSPFPPFGSVTWKTNSKKFDAYIYSLKGKSIGYVRIPDFQGDTKEAEEFREIIATMQKRSHALIVDLMNNPGGLAYHAYALVSMMSDQPLVNLKERQMITQKDLFYALDDLTSLADVKTKDEAIKVLGNDICGFPVDLKLIHSLVDLAHFIKDQYREGKYFTESYPMDGLALIPPHPKTRYTKPLLILVNSLSISCADIFPAILQDNKRAKILGSQTAGAGGYVLTRKYSNRLGLAQFTLTGSLIERFDGQPIEDLGVTPDFPYEFSEIDYSQNYVNFINYVNEVITNFKL